MSDKAPGQEAMVSSLVRVYAAALVLLLVLAPSGFSAYLYVYDGRARLFHAPVFHEIIIPVAIVFSAFVSFITFRCYQMTGKIFLRWLLMGLLAFTLIYAPHGFLTSIAHNNPWLFILYGPVSRLVMSACFLIAILHFGVETQPEQPSQFYSSLWGWMVFCLCIVLAVAALALSPIAGETAVRWSLEILAIICCLVGVVLIWLRQTNNQLMLMYAAALALFAQSSFAFMICPAWSHLWWYAHLIFAGGFGLLSYGVAIAFKRTGSFEDVYSQEELLAKLRVANANYERSNSELSHFAHLVSHDLQAPVRYISNFAQFLREDLGDSIPAESQNYLEQIERSSSRMWHLINGILKLSSLDKQGITTTAVDLKEIFQEIHELFKEELDTHGARFHYADLPVVQADRVLIFQVFQNLIQNAIKYRRPERPLKIDVDVSATDSEYCIAIADNGSGFDMANKDRIFQLFGRVHTEQISGTGAGLAICSKILKLHGGKIDARSALGEGATFYVFLPKGISEAPLS